MSRFLQRQGFKVRTAADGETGIDLARTLSPRAVLLDVMMPGIDGWSVLKALKADGTYDRILTKWKTEGGAITDFAVNPPVS